MRQLFRSQSHAPPLPPPPSPATHQKASTLPTWSRPDPNSAPLLLPRSAYVPVLRLTASAVGLLADSAASGAGSHARAPLRGDFSPPPSPYAPLLLDLSPPSLARGSALSLVASGALDGGGAGNGSAEEFSIALRFHGLTASADALPGSGGATLYLDAIVRAPVAALRLRALAAPPAIADSPLGAVLRAGLGTGGAGDFCGSNLVGSEAGVIALDGARRAVVAALGDAMARAAAWPLAGVWFRAPDSVAHAGAASRDATLIGDKMGGTGALPGWAASALRHPGLRAAALAFEREAGTYGGALGPRTRPLDAPNALLVLLFPPPTLARFAAPIFLECEIDWPAGARGVPTQVTHASAVVTVRRSAFVVSGWAVTDAVGTGGGGRAYVSNGSVVWHVEPRGVDVHMPPSRSSSPLSATAAHVRSTPPHARFVPRAPSPPVSTRGGGSSAAAHASAASAPRALFSPSTDIERANFLLSAKDIDPEVSAIAAAALRRAAARDGAPLSSAATNKIDAHAGGGPGAAASTFHVRAYSPTEFLHSHSGNGGAPTAAFVHGRMPSPTFSYRSSPPSSSRLSSKSSSPLVPPAPLPVATPLPPATALPSSRNLQLRALRQRLEGLTDSLLQQSRAAEVRGLLAPATTTTTHSWRAAARSPPQPSHFASSLAQEHERFATAARAQERVAIDAITDAAATASAAVAEFAASLRASSPTQEPQPSLATPTLAPVAEADDHVPPEVAQIREPAAAAPSRTGEAHVSVKASNEYSSSSSSATVPAPASATAAAAASQFSDAEAVLAHARELSSSLSHAAEVLRERAGANEAARERAGDITSQSDFLGASIERASARVRNQLLAPVPSTLSYAPLHYYAPPAAAYSHAPSAPQVSAPSSSSSKRNTADDFANIWLRSNPPSFATQQGNPPSFASQHAPPPMSARSSYVPRAPSPPPPPPPSSSFSLSSSARVEALLAERQALLDAARESGAAQARWEALTRGSHSHAHNHYSQ